jgi:hypothetical protein
MTRAQQEQACTPDVFRLCNAYIPNQSSIVRCLRAKRFQLSPACRTALYQKSTRRKRR